MRSQGHPGQPAHFPSVYCVQGPGAQPGPEAHGSRHTILCASQMGVAQSGEGQLYQGR